MCKRQPRGSSRLFLLLLLIAGVELPRASAQGVITTVAGTDWLFPGDGRPAKDAPLGGSFGMAVAVDAAGDFFIADADNHMVMRVGSDGILTVIGGNGIPAHSGDEGPATSAAVAFPLALAFGPGGDLYVTAVNTIRKINRGGVISTVAGQIEPGFSGDGGPALRAAFNFPQDLAVDAAGVIYIADTFNHRIRRITQDGIVTTIAGIGEPGYSGDGGPATSAVLNTPLSVAVDAAGNIYIADSFNGRVRRISPNGIITTVAGGLDINDDSIFSFMVPWSVRVDAAGALYIADVFTDRVRKVAGGRIITVAGSGMRGFSGDGGPAVNARLNRPSSIAIDRSSNIYIADRANSRIRKVTANGLISTVAGNGLFRTSGEGGPATSAALYLPAGAAVDPGGNLYLSEPWRNRVRKVSKGILTTFAGSGEEGFSGDGGPAAKAALFFPSAIAFDPASGSLLIADQVNCRVRRVTPDGNITTVAGNGQVGFSGDGGPAVNASLRFPEGLAVYGLRLYIADTDNQRIRVVDPDGRISTIAGNGEKGFSGDDGPAVRASLSDARGLAVDNSGNVYIGDTGNNRIRRIDISGTISTIAGTGTAGFSGDGGPAIEASLNGPAGLAFDKAGNLCFADENNHRIRCISPGGIITTVAGNGLKGLTGDGGPAVQASLAGPFWLAADSAGNIFFTDRLNHRLRQIKATPPAFRIEPSRLTFAGNSLATAPPSQRIRLFPGVPGVPFSATVATESGRGWLSVAPLDGTMPATIEVSVNPEQLASGTYLGTVTLLAPLCNPPDLTVAVEFQVGPALPARLAARPDALSFTLIEGSSASTQTLNVTNTGSGTVDFTVATATTSGGDWLSALPQSAKATASAGASIEVRADLSGLTSGTYTGKIVLTNIQNEQQVALPVIMSLNAVPQRMVVSPAGLAFAAVQNGGAVPAQSFQLLNAGAGELTWSAKVTQLSGGVQWLSISADSGSASGSFTGSTVEVRINPTGLAPGDYYGQIDISSPQAVNSPQAVAVALKLLPAATDPGPVVQPVGLVFRATQGASPGSQTILVSNLSNRPISFRSARVTAGGRDWFLYIPSDATVTPDLPRRIVVQPDTAKLAPGIYEGSLTLLFSDGTSRTVNLLLVNAPAAASPGVAFAEAPCTPAKLLPVFTSVGLETTVLAGWPNRLVVEVVDDCSHPMVDGSVVAEFSNNDPPLALTSQQDGKWSGIWQVISADASQVTIRLKASQPEKNINGTSEFTAAMRPGGDEPPVIFAGGVVSAASFAPRLPAAPGAFVSIFGARLSDRVELSQALPLEVELAGTSATIAGRRMPLLFTSEGQINAIVPYGIPMNTTHQLLVKRGNRIAAPETVTVAAAQPGILTRDQNGRGQGIVLFHSNGQYADAGNPAKAGDILTIYCLGLGPVDPGVTAGSASPFEPLSWVNGASLTIGGVQAQVLFAGLAPGWAGLYQVNAVVPPGVTPGDAVPVVLRVAGQESPPVTMGIRQGN